MNANAAILNGKTVMALLLILALSDCVKDFSSRINCSLELKIVLSLFDFLVLS
jgi:hypothetical protein